MSSPGSSKGSRVAGIGAMLFEGRRRATATECGSKDEETDS